MHASSWQRGTFADWQGVSMPSVGIAPNFFLSPVNGVNYVVGVQMPLEKVTTVNEFMSMPINTHCWTIPRTCCWAEVSPI
jgi:hypothetical protein